jgi:hypothetical protein
MCRPSDSPAIRLFSGEEKVCSKQDSFRVVPGSVFAFLEAGTIVDATSPPDRRARIIEPTAGLVFPDRFFSRFGEMVRRAIVSGYLTISAHAAFVPYSTMY